MTGNCHVPFWSRAGVATPRLRQQFFFEALPLDPGQPLQQTAAAIRDHIRDAAGLPVTIGVARTRTLAKLFSDAGKPFGAVAVLSREHERALLAKLPVTEISGIAGRRAAKLLPYGIRTRLDLADAPGHLVRQLLTKTGHELGLGLRGEPVTLIRSERPAHKNIARGGSLMGNVEDPGVLWAWAVRHTERLVEEIRYYQVRTCSLAVEVAWNSGDSTAGSCPLEAPSDRFDDLLDATRVALRKAYIPGGVATHMHVVAPELRRPRGFQLSLFDAPDPKRDAVAAVKERVNQMFGRFKLRSGATLRLPRVYADPANDWDICAVKGKVCF